MFIGASKSVGSGVRVGAGADAGSIAGVVLLLAVCLAPAVWVTTGVLLALTRLGALLGLKVGMDERLAEIHLIAFAASLAEWALYWYGIPAILG